MKTKELIELLQKLDKDGKLSIWIDYGDYEMALVDVQRSTGSSYDHLILTSSK